ncbi:MAG: EamA/RhaT family transporter, partial [Ruminococcus sp.]|nr:EamA/RhaT family transporter [Ruminococcus sp.]
MRQNQFLQKRGFAAAAAIFCTLLWGTAFPFIKLGYAAFAAADSDIGAKLLFAGLRFFIAGLMVL